VSGTFATDIEFELVTSVMVLGLLFPGTVVYKLHDGDELIFETGFVKRGSATSSAS